MVYVDFTLGHYVMLYIYILLTDHLKKKERMEASAYLITYLTFSECCAQTPLTQL